MRDFIDVCAGGEVASGSSLFGKRYLIPALGVWASPDPLAVHVPGQADLNLYAYVKGRLLAATDPLGLECNVDETCKPKYAEKLQSDKADANAKPLETRPVSNAAIGGADLEVPVDPPARAAPRGLAQNADKHLRDAEAPELLRQPVVVLVAFVDMRAEVRALAGGRDVRGSLTTGVGGPVRDPSGGLTNPASHTRDSLDSTVPPPGLRPDAQGYLTRDGYVATVPKGTAPFRMDEKAMAPHKTGSNATGKSQWLYNVDAESATFDAARIAEALGLWQGGKAKVEASSPIGVDGRSGELTPWINVYRSDKGMIHGSPGRPPKE